VIRCEVGGALQPQRVRDHFRACAQRVDAVVLTYDKHFRLIPGVRNTHHLEA